MMPGLFDEQFLLKKLDQKVDPLARLNSIVDWQIFLPIIENALGRDNASTAGRKPYPSTRSRGSLRALRCSPRHSF